MTKLGKLWTGAVAYISLLVGAGLSVAGNLADTYRTRGADIDSLDKVMAAGWPILVLLAIEMFVSPRWSSARMFQVWRWVGCLAVGGMAMVVSWTHLHDLMADRGQLFIVSVLGPLAIDGMAIMATGLILSTRVRGHVRFEPVSADTASEMLGWTPASADMSGHTEATPAGWTGPVASAADVADSEAAFRGHVSTDMTDPAETPVRGRDRWADLTGARSDTDDLMSWADGLDRAHADMAEELAAEAQAHLSAVTAPDRLPRRTRTASGTSVPQEFTAMVSAWDPGQVSRSDVVKLSAGYFGVSERTARRWLNVATGRPVSGPPER